MGEVGFGGEEGVGGERTGEGSGTTGSERSIRRGAGCITPSRLLAAANLERSSVLLLRLCSPGVSLNNVTSGRDSTGNGDLTGPVCAKGLPVTAIP